MARKEHEVCIECVLEPCALIFGAPWESCQQRCASRVLITRSTRLRRESGNIIQPWINHNDWHFIWGHGNHSQAWVVDIFFVFLFVRSLSFWGEINKKMNPRLEYHTTFFSILYFVLCLVFRPRWNFFCLLDRVVPAVHPVDYLYLAENEKKDFLSAEENCSTYQVRGIERRSSDYDLPKDFARTPGSFCQFLCPTTGQSVERALVDQVQGL